MPVRAVGTVVVAGLIVALAIVAIGALRPTGDAGPSAAASLAAGSAMPSATAGRSAVASGPPSTAVAASSTAPRATNATSRAPAKSAPASPTRAPSIDPESGLRTIRRSALPKEAVRTLALIAAGGPFPYSEDGSTYRNLERLLPAHPVGYYREYTVETPGSPDRGARRIVAGGAGQLYWTSDHYASFQRVVP